MSIQSREAIGQLTDKDRSGSHGNVANYLRLLADPQSLVDEPEVSSLAEKLQASHDPLERLSLRTQLDAASRPPPHAVEQAFVKHGLAWARREGITAEAFKAEGVSPQILARAGFPRFGQTRSQARPPAPGGQ